MAKTETRKATAQKSRRPKKEAAPKEYVLRLYVTGMTPRSARAVENIKRTCEEYMKGRYDLQVIDIFQQPVLARGEKIVATPTLIKKVPLPLRRLIGDMSDTERILMGLDLKKKGGS